MDGERTYKSALLTEANRDLTPHATGHAKGPLLLQIPTSGRGGLSMDMKLGLGAKAKLALTDSLDRLNRKFHLGTFPGVVQNQSSWSSSEMRVWMSVLFVGVACLYGNQVALPMTTVEVEEQLTWQRKNSVSIHSVW